VPSGSNLPDGTYTIWAYVYDKAGNRSDAAISITINQSATPSAPATSPARTASPVPSDLTSMTSPATGSPGGSGIGVEALDHVLRDWTPTSAPADADPVLGFRRPMLSDGTEVPTLLFGKRGRRQG
jgi:hypothetical protein